MPTPTPTPTINPFAESEAAVRYLQDLANRSGVELSSIINSVGGGVITDEGAMRAYEILYGRVPGITPTATPTPTVTPAPGLPWELAAQGQINPQPTDRVSVPLGAGEGQGSNMEAILAAWNALMATPTPTATPGPTPTPGFTPWPTATTPPTATPWPTYAPTATQTPLTPWPTATTPPTATPWPTYAPTATQTPLTPWPTATQVPTATGTPAPTPTPPTPSSVTEKPGTLIPPAALDMFFRWPTVSTPAAQTPSYAGERGPISTTGGPSLGEQFRYQGGEIPALSQSPYEYPEVEGVRETYGKYVGMGMEKATTDSIKFQAESIKKRHAEELAKYNSMPEGVVRKLAYKNLLILEEQYDGLLLATQTAGSIPRALSTLFASPSLLPMAGELFAETPGQLGYQIDALPGRLTPVPGSIGTTPDFATNVATPPITPEFTDLTQYLQPLSVMQTPQTQAGVPGLMQRGGMGMFNPASVANAPAGQLPVGNVPEGGGGVETPDGRGFASWKDLTFGMGTERPRVLSGGTPGDLTGALGKSGSEVNRTYIRGLPYGDSQYAIQNVDLGQGEQNYIVRRDAYGNVSSFTPASSSAMHPRDRLFRRY